MRKGFSLVELMVTVAIIALLAAILFPVLNSAKKKARQAVCIENMKQIGLAVNLYSESWDEKLPPRLSTLFPAFINAKTSFTCPMDIEKGQHEGTGRLEGNEFLPSGVSYTWVPNWEKAVGWGWWKPWPDTGRGKWLEHTPLAECHWHWATTYNKVWLSDRRDKAAGNAILLTAGGALRFWPGRRDVAEYTPD